MIKILIFILACYAFNHFFLSDYLARSAISDKPSILIKVWDDNGLSVGGINYDESEKTIALKEINRNKWFLKDKRKLSAEELDCLQTGFFATAVTNGDINFICDNGRKILDIN